MGTGPRQADPWVRGRSELAGEIRLIRGDLLDQGSLIAAVERIHPDEVYNLGAISYVPMSWQQAELTSEVTGVGVLRMLEAIRTCSGISGSRTPGSAQIRFYQASSSEMFGMVEESPQTERTPFHPRSPYGVAKAYGHFLTQNYRESYGMFAVSGILFNHESPRRGPEFVTRKMSLAVARIKLGLERELRLGNLAARRDWGFAGDYVRAMHLMLTQDEPEDFVVGTGVTRSVQELAELAFSLASLDWQEHVVCDTALSGQADVNQLCADPAKAPSSSAGNRRPASRSWSGSWSSPTSSSSARRATGVRRPSAATSGRRGLGLVRSVAPWVPSRSRAARR